MNNQSPHSHHGRGQATVEFALIFPLVVVCIGVVIGVLSACLTTLRLNDTARLAARHAATSSDTTVVQKEVETMCQCRIRISVQSDIVRVRAIKSFRLPVFGISLSPVELSAESFAMKEPTVIFQEPVAT